MKAIRISAIGEKLVEQSIVTPAPASGEVLVAVKAAGICHSDAHYRAGISPIPLPITPGHEIAGIIESVGPGVNEDRIGQRVCLHYLVTCGECEYCRRNIGQFCADVEMIGKDRDGGYAEYIVVPEQNAFALPAEIPFTHGAIMMCSYTTALHALRKARFRDGESVAIFGAGGLGVAAIGLSMALGASTIIAVDKNSAKTAVAESMGATGIDASDTDVVEAIFECTGGRGVDVALELVGLPVTSEQAIRSLAVQGRAAMVGLANTATSIDMYRDLIGREREIIGVSDHLPGEIDELIALVQGGHLDIAPAISNTVSLDAAAINAVFDELDSYSGNAIRTVISLVTEVQGPHLMPGP
ncbi:MAG: alcohol dehydrogenase catalytic domain-containing protein [Woeseiaceae bacterium]